MNEEAAGANARRAGEGTGGPPERGPHAAPPRLGGRCKRQWLRIQRPWAAFMYQSRATRRIILLNFDIWCESSICLMGGGSIRRCRSATYSIFRKTDDRLQSGAGLSGMHCLVLTVCTCGVALLVACDGGHGGGDAARVGVAHAGKRCWEGLLAIGGGHCSWKRGVVGGTRKMERDGAPNGGMKKGRAWWWDTCWGRRLRKTVSDFWPPRNDTLASSHGSH